MAAAAATATAALAQQGRAPSTSALTLLSALYLVGYPTGQTPDVYPTLFATPAALAALDAGDAGALVQQLALASQMAVIGGPDGAYVPLVADVNDYVAAVVKALGAPPAEVSISRSTEQIVTAAKVGLGGILVGTAVLLGGAFVLFYGQAKGDRQGYSRGRRDEREGLAA